MIAVVVSANYALLSDRDLRQSVNGIGADPNQASPPGQSCCLLVGCRCH
jgi:hypothetical protein